MIFAG